jgi:lipoprotein-anchoring transpeptidase ErfK/SrfK
MTNPNIKNAQQKLDQAFSAMNAGDINSAQKFANDAAKLAPELEEVWLMLGSLANARESVAYMERALKINPQSQRARKGMAWAVKRLREEDAKGNKKQAHPEMKNRVSKSTRSNLIRPALIVFAVLMCSVLAWAAWSASSNPALAFMGVENTEAVSWNESNVIKPTYTLTPSLTFTPTETFTPTATFTPSFTPTETATLTPTITDTPLPTDTPYPTDTPWPTWTSEPYVPPTAVVNVPAGVKWIDVDLTNQMLYAYEGDTLVLSSLVSTGTWLTPTVTGQFHIYMKYVAQDMSGPGYYLPNVPYVMYFYEDYGIHGTYWHSNFGTQMSHGCVNMNTPDAGWLYNWAPYGTLVNVHY